MKSVIFASRNFEAHWPFVVNYLQRQVGQFGEVDVYRLQTNATPLAELCPDRETVSHLFALGCDLSLEDLAGFTSLQEAVLPPAYGQTQLPTEIERYLKDNGVHHHGHHSEGFWGQSVAECGLALTLCALRRIPQSYVAMQASHDCWEMYEPQRNQGPDSHGAQFSDSLDFVGGTVAGKQVRVVGMGNIGSRYAKFMQFMGAHVKAYDPYTADQSFHLGGIERVWDLQALLHDADIFALMLPPLKPVQGLINRELIYTLPKGSILVAVTRTYALDMEAVRERILNNEITFAADVYDVEPVPLDDPLLGRDNVIHTPHIAGRTLHANQQWVDMLLAKLKAK